MRAYVVKRYLKRQLRLLVLSSSTSRSVTRVALRTPREFFFVQTGDRSYSTVKLLRTAFRLRPLSLPVGRTFLTQVRCPSLPRSDSGSKRKVGPTAWRRRASPEHLLCTLGTQTRIVGPVSFHLSPLLPVHGLDFTYTSTLGGVERSSLWFPDPSSHP